MEQFVMAETDQLETEVQVKRTRESERKENAEES